MRALSLPAADKYQLDGDAAEFIKIVKVNTKIQSAIMSSVDDFQIENFNRSKPTPGLKFLFLDKPN